MTRKLSDRQVIADRVVHFYLNIADRNKYRTVKHFEEEGEKRRTIYNILKRYDTTKTSTFRPHTGHPSVLITPEKFKKVKRLLTNKNKSLRQVAKESGLKYNRVIAIKKKAGIKTKKCRKVPKYKNDQAKRAKTNCRKIYRVFKESSDS